MAEPRIRRDVWKLPAGDTTLLWYRKAVAEMKKRPLDDAASWRFQAAIHEYSRGDDPLARENDAIPSDAVQRRYWNQCQHNSWFFLPWHRMYLAVFEEIVAAMVVELGGPAGWSLPYWNYSDASNPNARRLPAAFVGDRLPDGSENALWVADRASGNRGEPVATRDSQVDVTACLVERVFPATIGGSPGFGGGRTAFNHQGGVTGKVDQTPHGSMHGAVGGWMGFFNTAALDPIFWLHHANIDRLWTVWLRRDAKHHNPSEGAWLTNLSFEFLGPGGKQISLPPSQVVDTTTMTLPYRYEDETDPIAGPRGGPEVAAVKPGRKAMAEERIPEMVGATDRPIVLTGRPLSATLSTTAPTGPARKLAESAAAPAEIYLNVENVTGDGAPVGYTLYLNLPAGADPADHKELEAGVLPMFGVREASRANQQHGGSGVTYSLEVSSVVRVLQSRGDWDPANIRMTFVPIPRAAVPEAAAIASAAPISIGRVSLYLG